MFDRVKPGTSANLPSRQALAGNILNKRYQQVIIHEACIMLNAAQYLILILQVKSSNESALKDESKVFAVVADGWLENNTFFHIYENKVKYLPAGNLKIIHRNYLVQLRRIDMKF